MYFNGIPQGFGQAPQNNQTDLMNKPVFGYNEGIGGLQQQQQGQWQPAPQLGNFSAQEESSRRNLFDQAPTTSATSTAGSANKSLTPLTPYRKPMAGQAMARGGIVQQTLDKGGIVASGIAALRGQHPKPREAIDQYDKMFGPDATAELIRAYADGGVVSGPGSGVADLVPGSIDGREDVRIASGEYVIPAWAVAALGDGSTEAGAKVLDAMVARLREAGSELIKGSEPINPNEFLPA
jgi:hypothetical protein